MPNLIPQILKDAVFGPEGFDKKYEKNIAILGSRGASKTTILGLLGLTCEIESIDNKKFTYDIHEYTVGIRQIMSELCQGIFPPATPSGKIYEADILMSWANGWSGKKSVKMPLIETAGEDVEYLIGPYRQDMYHQMPNYQQAENLNKMIAQSNALILTVAVSRVPHIYPQVVDCEPKTLLADPDVNLVRILDGVHTYRERARSKPLEGIAVLLTKYDMVRHWLESQGMNLFTPEGQHLFLNTYLRQTMGKLKKYGYGKVKFFPIYVEVAKEVLPDGKLRFLRRADNGFVINTNPKYNLPVYTRASFHELIHWIKEIVD